MSTARWAVLGARVLTAGRRLLNCSGGVHGLDHFSGTLCAVRNREACSEITLTLLA